MTTTGFRSTELLDLGTLAERIRQEVDLPLIGVDGPGAAGKSTFAVALARALGAVVVQGDDFYLPSTIRPSGDFAPGAQFDLDRLRDQVLAPVVGRSQAKYQRYDWDHDRLGDWVDVPAEVPVIIEGIYSTEARLRSFYTHRIFCTTDRGLRLARGLERDGEAARSQWVEEWMPAEDRYFAEQHPSDAAHLVLDGSGTGEPRYTIIGGHFTS